MVLIDIINGFSDGLGNLSRYPIQYMKGILKKPADFQAHLVLPKLNWLYPKLFRIHLINYSKINYLFY